VSNAESVIVTAANYFFTKQLDGVEQTTWEWAVEVLARTDLRDRKLQQRPASRNQGTESRRLLRLEAAA
jgi:hypothetical protein